MPRWKLPLSQVGKGRTPSTPPPLNTRQTMGAMTEKRVKHKHRITKRFLCVSFSSSQVELLSETF